MFAGRKGEKFLYIVNNTDVAARDIAVYHTLKYLKSKYWVQ